MIENVFVREVLLAFIPIFVAIDAIGVMPMFVGFTSDLDDSQRHSIVLRIVITALVLSLGFIWAGQMIFQYLGIKVGDFMVAGGLILFSVAILELFRTSKYERSGLKEDLGIVPFGTPIIAGPALLTTLILVLDQYSLSAVISALVLNLLVVSLVLSLSMRFVTVLGYSGIRAASKIIAVFLAAYAVSIIRNGLVQLFVD